MIPHGLKVSTNQETVKLVAILPFKQLNVFVDIVELSMAATLDSDLNELLTSEEELQEKKFEIYFHNGSMKDLFLERDVKPRFLFNTSAI